MPHVDVPGEPVPEGPNQRARDTNEGAGALAYLFQYIGDVWHVRYEQEYGTFEDSKGMRHLAKLLACPERPIAALALQSMGRPVDPRVDFLERPSSEDGPSGTGFDPVLIEEAQALKQALHDAYGRTTRLLAGLKRHREQSKLMASTLAGLRQLQRLHPGED